MGVSGESVGQDNGVNLSGRADAYDAFYFATSCGRPYERNEHWLSFFGAIADRIVADIHPRTVLDAGCAMGFLVEALRDRGVEAFGIDVSEYALQNVRADIRSYCSLHSICDPFARNYDLIVCIEVLEHLDARAADRALANLCDHSEDILFSSTPLDFSEATHRNVQSPEYWADLFAQRGFLRDVDFDASFVTSWAVRFRRRPDPLHRIVRDYERRFWPLWKENCDLRNALVAKEQQLSDLARNNAEIMRRNAEIVRSNAEIVQSDTWRLAQKFQRVQHRLAPSGTLRHRLVQRLVGRLLQ